jgi:hypothetical protein
MLNRSTLLIAAFGFVAFAAGTARAAETGIINQAGPYEETMRFYLHPAHGFPGTAEDGQQPGELGEHPAVLVHRNWSKRGYDYASQMYAHPAGLALSLEAPREMGEPQVAARPRGEPGSGPDHSAVAVAKPVAHR